MATKKQLFHLRETIETSAGLAQAVRLGDLLYVGSVNSMNADGMVQGPDDMGAQLQHLYENFRTILDAHGVGFENVIKETIYTRDADALFQAFQHRQTVYEDLPPPAMTIVEVSRMMLTDVLVIIEAIVELPSDI